MTYENNRDLIDTYLKTLQPMRAGKANKSLSMQVRYNGVEFMWRHIMVERCVRNNYQITTQRGERVLMSPDGSFFDTRNITATGIDYAAWLIATRGQ